MTQPGFPVNRLVGRGLIGRVLACVLAGVCAIAAIALGASTASAQPAGIPALDIWGVKLGKPVTDIPFNAIAFAACGTNGGPPAAILDDLKDYSTCRAEASGLHEVYFEYDDEEAYIARALRLEWEVIRAGTSMYAHPVIPSVLVDNDGIVRGIRVVTDDRIRVLGENQSPDEIRAAAYLLAVNLKNRFADWALQCEQVPAAPGQTPVGRTFFHEICRGENATLGQRLVVDGHFFRRAGQVGIDIFRQEEVAGAFESTARFELLQMPYEPKTVHDR